jgi:hypothetical protein
MDNNPDEVWSRIKGSPLNEDARSVYPDLFPLIHLARQVVSSETTSYQRSREISSFPLIP